jgi:DNA repair protein RadC
MVFPFFLENAMTNRNVEAMTNRDLLALVVGPRTAARMLKQAQSRIWTLLNECTAPYEVEQNAAIRLKAAAELMRRALAEELMARDVLSNPKAVRDYLRLRFSGLGHEVFLGLFLDAQNQLIACDELSCGTLSQTSVYPREVVKRALYHNAAAVIFAHNHPSGSAEPSRADEVLTSTLRE